MSLKRGSSEVLERSQSKKPNAIYNDVLMSLRAKYPTADALERHLNTLDASHVVGLLLRAAYPTAGLNLQHCIYCHKTFNTRDNHGCKIPHRREWLPVPGTDDVQFLCCGLRVSRTDIYDGDMWPEPEEDEPYCYEGPHHAEPIVEYDEGDEDEEEPYRDVEERNGIKWWEEPGLESCTKLKCAEQLAV